MDSAKKKKHSFRNVSIRWRLFTYIAIFIIFTLLVVWLFQVKLLDHFYGAVKRDDLERFADMIENNIDSDTLEATTYQYAVNYGVCVRMLRIDGPVAFEELTFDVEESCVLHHVDEKYLSILYNRALNNDGEYYENKTRQELYDAGYYYPPFYMSGDGDKNSKNTDMQVRSTILVRIIENKTGDTYAIMLNAEMTPMRAVSKMLSTQYLWISVALLSGALIMTLIISKDISNPIERMNHSAKRLAKGDYDVNFQGGGFKEILELSDTLNVAADELSKTDRLQKELIANISHDLRTPLTMITGYSEVMRDIPGENTPENVQVIIDEANRLSELVSALLDLSKLQAGSGKLDISTFNLTSTIKDAMHRYAKLTEHHGYRIEFYSDNDVFITADRNMILQVLYNLINNAINYIGGDKLVKVTQKVHYDKVRVSVSDHGKGIAPDQLRYIWDRYYKVDKVHCRATVGTGIGLSIVKGVLEAHGAKYGVDSELGKGSTFWFELDLGTNVKETENKHQEGK